MTIVTMRTIQGPNAIIIISIIIKGLLTIIL